MPKNLVLNYKKNKIKKRKEFKGMKKNELIKAVAQKTEMTNKVVGEVISAYHDVVIETLQADVDEKVPFEDFGFFKVKKVAERTGTSALNGKDWVKPAHNELTFSVSRGLKDI